MSAFLFGAIVFAAGVGMGWGLRGNQGERNLYFYDGTISAYNVSTGPGHAGHITKGDQ